MISKHLAEAIVHEQTATRGPTAADAIQELMHAKAAILNALSEVDKTIEDLRKERKDL